MSLRLNFYHEIHQERSARKRDPLKISAYILGAVIAGFAALYAFEYSKYVPVSRELAQKTAEIEDLRPKAAAAEKREQEFQATQKLTAKLVKSVEDRFYWAPVLEEVTALVPRDVQLTKLAGEVQGEGLRKCLLTVDGLSAGADPRRVAEDLRQSIAENFGKKFKNVDAKFRSLEDGTEAAVLGAQQWPTAVFAINIHFESGEAPAPLAPRAPGGKKKVRAADTETP